MLDFNMSEMMVVAIVALLVIGPKDLPKAMRFVGYWVGRARGVARQFRSGFDSMVREAELAEMEKKWAEENARIMREHPPEADAAETPALEHAAEPNAAAGTDPGADPLAITDPEPVEAAPEPVEAAEPVPTPPAPESHPADPKVQP